MSVQPNRGVIQLDAPGAYSTRADLNNSKLERWGLPRHPAPNAASRAHGLRGEKDHASVPSYPLPAQSIAKDAPTEEVKLFAAGSFVTVFLSLWFAIPIVLIGIMLRFQ